MYIVSLTDEAKKNIYRLPKHEQKKVKKKLLILAQNPYLGKKLNGELESFYCLRAWPYRILYKIYQNQLLITVLKIAHRQGVYK